MSTESKFWDEIAPHLAPIENSFFDRRTLHHLLKHIQEPVLVVGAGQGLLLAELVQRGLQCAGIDLSREMIRYAKLRRGLDLIEADARSLPFAPASYSTIIYA